MALAAYNFVVQDDLGNIVDGASIEVRSEVPGQPLVALYADRDGATPLGNPYTLASGAAGLFHLFGGSFQITATKAGLTRTWRYVAIGTAGENDTEALADSTAVPPRTVTAAGAVTVTAADVLVIINKTVGAATTVNLPPAADRNFLPLIIKDGKGDAATNIITIVPNGSETIDGNASWPISSNKASLGLRPNEAQDGWVLT